MTIVIDRLSPFPPHSRTFIISNGYFHSFLSTLFTFRIVVLIMGTSFCRLTARLHINSLLTPSVFFLRCLSHCLGRGRDLRLGTITLMDSRGYRDTRNIIPNGNGMVTCFDSRVEGRARATTSMAVINARTKGLQQPRDRQPHFLLMQPRHLLWCNRTVDSRKCRSPKDPLPPLLRLNK